MFQTCISISSTLQLKKEKVGKILIFALRVIFDMPGRKAEEMIPVAGRPRMERFPPTASYTPGERKTSEDRKWKEKKDRTG